MSIFGIGKKGFGILKPKPSPTISSVKPSIHITKKAQKTSEMKIQFNKQKNRTISDRNKASAKTFDTSKGTGKDIQKRNEATKKMFKDAKGEK
jgi:hypothetical protein